MDGNNIMLDLETMGNGGNSAIIAVGAVRFDTEVRDKFYRVVDLKSNMDIGLSVDPDTIMWWMKQSDAARAQFNCSEIYSLPRALVDFSEWVGSNAIVWGNGAAFDNIILSNAYRKADLPQPWAFWNDRCYRTIKNLNKGIELERIGTYHNAVDDAESQALHLIKIMEETV